MLTLLSCGLYLGNLYAKQSQRGPVLDRQKRRENPYCFIHICIKCHAANAAVEVVFGVDIGSWDENVPKRKVEFSSGAGAPWGRGDTTYGNKVSSIVPLTSLSYEYPTWTGWSM